MGKSKVAGMDSFVVANICALLLFAGCGDKEKPPEKAEQALSQAQTSVDRADELIAEMRRSSEELQQKIEQQRSALDALIEKRLVLLRQQLTAYEQRVQRLPAAKENELKLSLADLKQRFDALAGKFQAYRDAPREKSAAVLQELETALEEFESSHQKFTEEIPPA
jgi:chromosome segregation ATPase